MLDLEPLEDTEPMPDEYWLNEYRKELDCDLPKPGTNLGEKLCLVDHKDGIKCLRNENHKGSHVNGLYALIWL